jgi:hypothetical protein
MIAFSLVALAGVGLLLVLMILLVIFLSRR